MVFDPGGCLDRLRGCSFLEGWHALLSGWVRLDAAMVFEAGAFLPHGKLEHYFG